MHDDTKPARTRAIAADVDFKHLAGIIYVLLNLTAPISAQVCVSFADPDNPDYPDDLADLYGQLSDPGSLPLQLNTKPGDWPPLPAAWTKLDLSLDCVIQVEDACVGFEYGDQVGIAVMLVPPSKFPTAAGDIVPDNPFQAYFHYVQGEDFSHSNALVFVCDNTNQTENPLASYSFSVNLGDRRGLVEIKQLLGVDPHIKNNG